MRKLPARLFLSALIAISAGCGGTYAPPPPNSEPESIGTVIGTRLGPGRFFLSVIDKERVENASQYAERPLPIEEGRHLLIARFEQGDLFAEAEIMIDIQPDQQLTLVGTVLDESFPGVPARVGFSLVDESLQIPITAEIQRSVMKKLPPPGATPEPDEFALPAS